MNDTVFEGTTLEDALSKAAEALGVAPDALEYEVTEESDGGFWGLDESFVRLRAQPRKEEEEATGVEQATEDEAEVSPAEEEDQQSEPEPPPSAEAPAPAAHVDPPVDAELDPGEPESAESGGFWAAPDKGTVELEGVDEPARDAEEAPETDKDPADAETPSVEEAPSNEEIQIDEGARAAPDGGDAPATAAREAADEEVGTGGDPAADASPEIESLVTKILAGMDFDCSIDVQAEAEVYMAMVGGADKELLLEGNGRPLSALELILNHAFRHRLTERRKIRVDAGDFRSRREDELRDLAFQVAHSAKETERTQETQPLNPYERRLVHLALAEDSKVTTRSRGSGFLKNVQVIPRRSGHGNR